MRALHRRRHKAYRHGENYMDDFRWTMLGLVALAALRAMRAGGKPRPPGPAAPTREPRWATLATAMQRPGDNFLLIRLLAAAAVIYGHSYALCGIPGAADHIARLGLGHGLYSGSIAVDVFFVVSGFLVTGAWLRRPDLGFFLWSRALRILPAYLACLMLSAFLLGPCFTTLTTGEYLRHPETWRYVVVNLQLSTDLRWSLPGVFHTNPHPDTLNGSIWTLPVEARMYAWLALFGLLGLLERRERCLLALIALAAMAYAKNPLPMLPLDDFVRLAGFFALGSLAWQWRERIPFHGAIAPSLLLLSVVLRQHALFAPLFALALAYAVLWFAYVPKGLLGFNRLGDYSYGVYLWGFPLQQAVAQALPSPTPTLITLCSLPLALTLGVLSWHLLEHPLLRLKRPRRPDAATTMPPLSAHTAT